MSRPARTVLGWAVLALLGLVLAAGAAYAASRVATQPIGLSSEPITAGRQLAPQATRPDRAPARRRPRRSPTATPTSKAARTPTETPPPTTTAAPTVDDHGGGSGGSEDGPGRGRGRGRGRGGDD